jgi:ABC-type uncharacterized transport system YnjBCD ATPase subunit
VTGDIDLDFSGSPTTWRFLQDDSFVRGLMGPVGSGMATKLALNQLIASLTHAFSLSLHLVQRQGVAVETFMQLLRGSARLQFEDEAEPRDLCVGDSLMLAPHRRHRLLATDPDPGTLWLALFWWDDG